MTRTIVLSVFLVVAAAIVGITPKSVHAGGAQCSTCYEMMVNYCTAQANNAAEGGFDAAYDQCVANWYASAGCSPITPMPTDGNKMRMHKTVKAPPKPTKGK